MWTACERWRLDDPLTPFDSTHGTGNTALTRYVTYVTSSTDANQDKVHSDIEPFVRLRTDRSFRSGLLPSNFHRLSEGDKDDHGENYRDGAVVCLFRICRDDKSGIRRVRYPDSGDA